MSPVPFESLPREPARQANCTDSISSGTMETLRTRSARGRTTSLEAARVRKGRHPSHSCKRAGQQEARMVLEELINQGEAAKTARRCMHDKAPVGADRRWTQHAAWPPANARNPLSDIDRAY